MPPLEIPSLLSVSSWVAVPLKCLVIDWMLCLALSYHIKELEDEVYKLIIWKDGWWTKSKRNSQTVGQRWIEDAFCMQDLTGETDCSPPCVDSWCCFLLCVLGCKTEWDEIRCWLRADVGQVVNVSCSEVFQHFSSKQGQQMKNCFPLFCVKVMRSKCTAERKRLLYFFGLNCLAVEMWLFWAFFPVMTLKPTLVWLLAPWHIGGVIKWVTDAFIPS